MNPTSSHAKFYTELETYLPTSDGVQRKSWANNIVNENIDLKELSKLLQCEHKIASRFLWLLSDVGTVQQAYLAKELPFLFALCEKVKPSSLSSFATFWLIAGVPIKNEARAIDLLFQWVLALDVTPTIKVRAFLVLFQLTIKYPELKNELKLCLNDQLDKHSSDFRKKTIKILDQLDC